MAEGRAESFAGGVCGLGSCTTTLGLEELRGLWPRHQARLHGQDFGVVRGYILGGVALWETQHGGPFR
ncbi:hypothetical protein [Deinococcus hopiensis]|uniref:Uncharacterized protein n=1 Tax=Deinococcus hopiensis KR-140 TaxID=695939 RepID=A0A1W1VDH4_9DEIO|nr:hypothetical protein [Deinococcus hopiensis]SMB91250.1 hypothetical protein SAMN00790413_01062 [Deinococcus hopiensis KR-140]